MEFYSLLDFVLFPIYLPLLYLVASAYARRKVDEFPWFRYYVPGLMLKIFGGISFLLVYTIYYPGGDTVQYFRDSISLQKLMFENFDSFSTVMQSKANVGLYQYFSPETGYPAYLREGKAWTIVKIGFVLSMFALRSFMVTTMFCALISFLGVWHLYQVFVMEFPRLQRQMAIAFFFVPSVFFWGSGLLKDSFMIGAIGFFVWGLYYLVVKKQKLIPAILAVIIAGYLIVTVKPYIMTGLVPAIILWVLHRILMNFKAVVLKTALLPILMVAGFGVGFATMQLFGEALAEYNIETLLEKAVVTQRDLKSDYYQGNSFDIGEFDSDPISILSKFPIATFSAIYRPLIIESNNLVMFLSSFENLIILLFSLKVLFRIRFVGLFRSIFNNHLLTFSFVFSLFFAFSVGLATSNFGSLVRYKIPCIPFFIASLFIIEHVYKSRTDVNSDEVDNQ
ncbi:MAG: hypothetical protein RLZZ630_1123 [Bacteroidota bacterium]